MSDLDWGGPVASSTAGGDWLEKCYGGIAVVVWLVTFVSSWIYCISEYGYLLGFGLGWLPSVILAYLVALLWPLIALAIAALITLN